MGLEEGQLNHSWKEGGALSVKRQVLLLELLRSLRGFGLLTVSSHCFHSLK